MESVIEQLKKNKRPFGLMTEEMQEKARDIGHTSFKVFCTNLEWQFRGPTDEFVNCYTYRLRPDYKEEQKPEIVECEIIPATNLTEPIKFRHYNGNVISVHKAVSQQGFSGFKFGDLKQVINKAVGYSHNDVDILPFVQYDDLKSGKYKVLHATHVLMRRQT